jgi:hypothetical protein
MMIDPMSSTWRAHFHSSRFSRDLLDGPAAFLLAQVIHDAGVTAASANSRPIETTLMTFSMSTLRSLCQTASFVNNPG